MEIHYVKINTEPHHQTITLQLQKENLCHQGTKMPTHMSKLFQHPSILLQSNNGRELFFHGYCLDSEGARRLKGNPQFRDYQKHLRDNVKTRSTTNTKSTPHSFRFGDGTHRCQ